MSKINGDLFGGMTSSGSADDIMSEEEYDAVENGVLPEPDYVEEYSDEAIEEAVAVYQTEDEELENDQELVTNARLRLDQGRLYEMVISHNFFEQMDANPKAIANVQREIRNFAKERLEVLLGLKPDPKLNMVKTPAPTKSQFSELEADILKKFLSKMSNGATEKVKEIPKVEARPKSNQMAPISVAPKKQEIKPMQPIRPAQQSAVRVTQPQAKVQPRPVPQAPRPPTRATKVEEDKPLKPLHLMNAQEIRERNERASARQAGSQVMSKKAKPMPSEHELTAHYMTQQARSGQSGTISTLVALVQNQKNKQGVSDDDERY